MTPEPGDDRTACPAGRGRLRASHADRDQVIDTLKDAFVQGRLTNDELDSRVGRALASRTHADLAALTADLPTGLPTAKPPSNALQARPENTTAKNGARVIAATTVLAGGVWAGALLSQTDSQAVGSLVWAFTVLWLGIVTLIGAVMLESRRQRRRGGQLPPAPGRGGQPSERAVSPDPAGQLRPGDHRRPHAAEASRHIISRPLVPDPAMAGLPGWH